jgi:hypothetical protein
MNFNESVNLANQYVLNENFISYSDNLIFLIKNIKDKDTIRTLLYNNSQDEVDKKFNDLIKQIIGKTKKNDKVKIIDSDKVIVFENYEELEKSIFFNKRKIILGLFKEKNFYCYEGYSDSFFLLYQKSGRKNEPSSSGNNNGLNGKSLGGANNNSNKDKANDETEVLLPKG